MTSQPYCLTHGMQHGSSRYYSLLHVAPDKKLTIQCLDAWMHELDKTVSRARDVDVARQKLQWWRDEIQRCFDGSAQHPLTQYLEAALQRWNLPLSQFEEVIDGYEMDLDGRSYASQQELELYLLRTGSVPAVMTSEILGYEKRETLKATTRLGTRIRASQRLRDIHSLVSQGLLPFSIETLEGQGVTFEVLRTGITTEEIASLLCDQFTQVTSAIADALHMIPDEERVSQHPHLIMAKIELALIEEIQREHCPILEHNIELTPLRKLLIAWKTYFCLRFTQRACS